MEYMTMLDKPSMVGGLRELIDDENVNVVKRTIRVFTNVYRHSLALLASGELDPIKYEKSYFEINNVSNKLIDMLKTSENEGVVVHLVRYLEAALVSHILSDLSKHPHIAEMTSPFLKKGVTALLELVNTPYVGGTAFSVAIRALITVACYQVDMRLQITDLAEKLINSPPPNLFDHNVRSFHKTLQRNLFRLLKRAEKAEDKERLIDLMVRVGLPRKRLAEWAPPRKSRKRVSPSLSKLRALGKDAPPLPKYRKLTEHDIIRSTSSTAIRNTLATLSGKPTLPDKQTEMTLDKKASSILDLILSGGEIPGKVSVPVSKKSGRNSPENRKPADNSAPNISEVDPIDRKSPLTEVSNTMPKDIVATGRKSPVSVKEKVIERCYSPTDELLPYNSKRPVESETDSKEKSGNLNLLKNFAKRCSSKEKHIYEKVTTPFVVDLLLDATHNLPEKKPDYIPSVLLEDLELMKEKLSILLAIYIPDNILYPNDVMTNDSTINSDSSVDIVGKTINSSSPSNSENLKCDAHLVSGDSLFSSKDIDLRCKKAPGLQEEPSLSRGTPSSDRNESSNKSPSYENMPNSRESSPPTSDKVTVAQDIDMRNLNRTRDPRVNKTFTSSASIDVDQRMANNLTQVASTPQNRDPRLGATGKPTQSSDPRVKYGKLYANSDQRATPISASEPNLCPPISQDNNSQFRNSTNLALSKSNHPSIPAALDRPPPPLFPSMQIPPAMEGPTQIQQSMNSSHDFRHKTGMNTGSGFHQQGHLDYSRLHHQPRFSGPSDFNVASTPTSYSAQSADPRMRPPPSQGPPPLLSAFGRNQPPSTIKPSYNSNSMNTLNVHNNRMCR